MSPEVLETYIRDYLALQEGHELSMTWQGGEPTLLGLEFFEQVVALQQKYAGGRKVANAIQTNGTRLVFAGERHPPPAKQATPLQLGR